MGRLIVTLAGLSLALATIVACSEASPTPTATPSPTATPTPTSTPVPAPTSTPAPVKEWMLEDIRVHDSTVTVSLRVFAGVGVWPTLDGRRADTVEPMLPIIEYIFTNVASGTHALEVRDVIGNTEATEVVTSGADPDYPHWLSTLIRGLQSAPVGNPPASIIQYEYKGQTVYYVPPQCCDIFSDLYDADGNIIGHPDGGLTGSGDGRIPDFSDLRTDGQTVWEDKRTYPLGHVQAPAPIESVEVLVLESFPPQYQVHVVSGLPNGCTTYGGFRMTRNAGAIQIEMVNWHPADPDLACTEQYGLVETWVPLGSDFVSGETHTVEVNDMVETFIAQ